MVNSLVMGIIKYYLLILADFFITVPAQARPVSYPGGWTVMTMNNGDMNSAHIHYSPTAKTSIGCKAEYWRADQFTINAVQMNNLIKRWNKKDSQANLYLKSGLGVASNMQGDFANDHDAAAFTGFATDWENRYTEAGDIADGFRQSVRVGVAPYIEDYGDIHTWLMLQVEHSPEDNKKITVTPLVRFFKGVNLMEAGFSNQGDVLFNWVIRY